MTEHRFLGWHVVRASVRQTGIRAALCVAIALMCAAVSFGYVAPNAGPTRAQALDAIAVLENKLLTPEAVEAARTVVTFADKSDTVLVTIGEETMPWTAETWKLPEETQAMAQSMLMAAFVAGNIKTQLASGKVADDPYSGWIAALSAYKQLQAKVKFSSPSLDALEDLRKRNKLRDHVRDLQRSAPAQKTQ